MPIYRDIYAGPPRSYGGRTTKRYVIVHSTQNDASAEGEASYARTRTDGVSFHYAVDWDSIVQVLDTDLRGHHVGSRTGNDTSIGYEFVGFASWSHARWLDRIAWHLAAAQIRKDCDHHSIVPQPLSIAQIQAGKLSGIITHNQARLAWGVTTHTDPGDGFPMGHLISLVEDDMPLTDADVKLIWQRDIQPPPPGYDHEKNPTWSAISTLNSAQLYSRRGYEQTEQILATQQAILAKLTGDDVVAAVKAELAKHDTAVAEQLAEIAALVGQVGSVPAEQIVDEIAARLAQ